MKEQPPGLLFKKAVRKHLCWSLLLKKTSTQFFSCKYCKTFKNTYFEEHLRTAATGICQFRFTLSLYYNLRDFFEMISKYPLETTTYYTIKHSGKFLSVGGFGLLKKCLQLELFWSAFSRIWTEYCEILRIQRLFMLCWTEPGEPEKE